MPLIIQKNINSEIKLAVWKVNESLEELEVLATGLQDTNHQHIKLNTKKKEFLLNRILLAHLANPQARLSYHPTGQPYSKAHKISISHCKGYQTMLLSANTPVGLDLECERSQLKRIQHKFVSEEELALLSHLPAQKRLLFAWCAKEAAYKYYAKRNIGFRENLQIKKVDDKLCILLAIGQITKFLALQYLVIDRHTLLVLCVEQAAVE